MGTVGAVAWNGPGQPRGYGARVEFRFVRFGVSAIVHKPAAYGLVFGHVGVEGSGVLIPLDLPAGF